MIEERFISTIRSLITGSPRIGSTVNVCLQFLTRILQARPLIPLIRIASEPQTPCAPERSQAQGVVVIPLDALNHVEHPVDRVEPRPELFPVRSLFVFGVIPADLEGELRIPRVMSVGYHDRCRHEADLSESSRRRSVAQYFRISSGYLGTRWPSFSMVMTSTSL